MVTTQMKTDAQRLGNGKKAFNVKQVEKMLEDAGGSYTAGTGIDITNDEISVDTTAIQEKLTAGDGIAITDNVISVNIQSGYHLVEGTDWSDYFIEDTDNSLIVKEDILLEFQVSSGTEPICVYIPPLKLSRSYSALKIPVLAQYLVTNPYLGYVYVTPSVYATGLISANATTVSFSLSLINAALSSINNGSFNIITNAYYSTNLTKGSNIKLYVRD